MPEIVPQIRVLNAIALDLLLSLFAVEQELQLNRKLIEICRLSSKTLRTKLLTYLALIAALLPLAGCKEMFEAMPHKKWGFIDKTGKMVIEPQFDDVLRDQYGGCFPYSHKMFKNFSEGLCAVRLGNKWGYIDKTGKFVIEAKYDNAGTFSEGVGCVRLGQKCGYVDKTGKFVLPLQFDAYEHSNNARSDNPDWDFTAALVEKFGFSDGLAVARKDGKEGYIDHSGKFVIAPKFASAGAFEGGVAKVETGENMQRLPGSTFIDKTGNPIIKTEERCLDYSDKIFLATNGKYDATRKLYYLNAKGERLTKEEYVDARIFSEGLGAVAMKWGEGSLGSQGTKYGYIDKAGEIVIPAAFQISGNNLAGNFHSGRAIVSKTELDVMGNYHTSHGIIDAKGNWVLKPKYNHIAAYCDGLARAFSDNGTVYLDMNGNEAVKTNSPWGNSFSEGLAAVMAK